MTDLPCTCTDTYTCNRCRLRYWRQQRADAHIRMVNNHLRPFARDPEITDEQWCVLIYLQVQNDLDRLLCREEAS